MKKYFKRLVKSLLYFPLGLSVPDRSLNIIKTLTVNVKILGLRGLFCWPICIYNNTKIYNIGKFQFNCTIKSGLINIGEIDEDAQGVTKLINRGTIIIDHIVEIRGGSIINNEGIIHFKGHNVIGYNTNIFIRKKLIVGKQTRIGFNSFIMDSDEHFTVNVENFTVKPITKEIVIGDYNWFGNSTFIKKGVITPDYLIVASSNSQLIRDYTDLSPYSVIAGSPAKFLVSGIRRIYEPDLDLKLKRYFVNHPDADSFKLDVNSDLDDICSDKREKT